MSEIDQYFLGYKDPAVKILKDDPKGGHLVDCVQCSLCGAVFKAEALIKGVLDRDADKCPKCLRDPLPSELEIARQGMETHRNALHKLGDGKGDPEN